MEQTTFQSIPRNKFVKVSFVVERKLKELDRKLLETENKLNSTKDENNELHKTIAVLQDNLNSSEENQKRLTEENELLKFKLKTSASLIHSEGSDFETKYEESKAEYQILSFQLDLLEDDVSDLVCENKQLLVEIEALQISLKEVTQSKEEKQNNFEKANQEIYELKQLVSLLEFAAEETSTQNLTLQQTIDQVLIESKRTSEYSKPNNSNSRNNVSSGIKFRSKTENTERALCDHNGQSADKIPEEIRNNLNMDKEDKITFSPHGAVYLGLFMKSGRFPCKCGKEFGTKQDLKTHTINENKKRVGCKNCERSFASQDEMKSHMKSFHKNVNNNSKYHKFSFK